MILYHIVTLKYGQKRENGIKDNKNTP
jgi:hypothetical protein